MTANKIGFCKRNVINNIYFSLLKITPYFYCSAETGNHLQLKFREFKTFFKLDLI